jgi:tripartite-type tricarboxylate transporter receptor subunit TctC
VNQQPPISRVSMAAVRGRRPKVTARTAAWAILGAGVLLASLAAAPARAQSVADFDRGKTVNVLIGVGVGGEYDLQARLVARHLGKHIPGNPTLVPQNMTGAGGIKMANYLFAQAPRDGTTIGMLGNNFAATQAVGGQGVQFDVRKFRWLGTIAPVVETMAVWHTAGVKTIEDVRRKEVVAGASGKGAITFIYPSMMNELLGTKFKIVTGYAGGNEINLAMERGEVQARNNTWSSWKATKAAWLKDGKISVIVQAGPRAPDLDVPSVEDLARTPDERKVIELVVSGTRLGRPMAATPDVPEDRLAALRAAYRATMADPAFLAEAANLNFEVAPVYGEDMQKIVGEVMSTPKELAARARHLLE